MHNDGMGAQRELRSLTALVQTASTARVLNLTSRAALAAEARSKTPLFKHPMLDRAILVKHRLRPYERDWFVEPPGVATKILIPLNPQDLTVGAHSFLVGQRGCRQIYSEVLGLNEEGEHDLQVLAALDELPTLDPFLTREHLKRRGIVADDAYFEISPGDLARMFDYVKQNIVPLVTMCFSNQPGSSTAQADRLAQKILASDMDATMDPLRMTLRLDGDQFQESIFCWKGFLYYKWVLNDCIKVAHDVADEIESVRVHGKATTEEASYIMAARGRMQTGIKKACREVRNSLDCYDQAFEALTLRADPSAFRDFLLQAPGMFFSVGDRLGAVQHITSFWRYRCQSGLHRMTAPELFDILVDFESSLGFSSERVQSWN